MPVRARRSIVVPRIVHSQRTGQLMPSVSATRAKDYGAIPIAGELCRFGTAFTPILEGFLCRRIKCRPLRQRVIYAVRLIGFRERAFLTKISADLCGVRWTRCLPIAIAAECFIASALTADDVVDRAESRWRKPSAWKRWGNDQTWLIAETLHVLAHESLADAEPVSAEGVRDAFHRFFEGQFREILPGCRYSEEEAIALAADRTGALLKACLVAPAKLANSPYLPAIARYGRYFGTAFQLADDVFDFVGDPKTMGKPILGDLLNAQPNLVLAHAVSTGRAPLRRRVIEWLGKGVECRPPDPTAILQALESLGSIEHASRLVTSYLQRADDALKSIQNGKHKSKLRALLGLISAFPERHAKRD